MIEFGDHVRIKSSPDTEAAGIAGLEGDVHGFTTPSSTGVEVLGGAPGDYALHVYIEGYEGELWLRPELLEFLDHSAGQEMVIGNHKAIRQADGTWLETTVKPDSPLRRLLNLFKK